MSEDESDKETFLDFDDFMKVDLRVGLVREAERVEKSNKLLKLSIDLGEGEPRQVVAGISEHYAAEELVGRRVVVVANLKPRKLMGIESHGMVLAASDADGLCVVGVDRELQPGARAK